MIGVLVGVAWAASPLHGLQFEDVQTPTYSSRHALLIGNADYDDPTGWRDLPGVAEDIEELEATLMEHQRFDSVTVLTDLTRDAFDRETSGWLDAMARIEAPDQALLVVYYAGHGFTTTSATGTDLAWVVPIDAERPKGADVAVFQAGAVSMRRFLELGETARARHVMFLFDSCFSGSVFELASRGVPSSGVHARMAEPVRRIYTAGTKAQQVPDDSVFQRALVRAWSSPAADVDRDGYLTGVELGEYLYDEVKADQGAAQTPQYGTIRPRGGGAEGDVVFEVANPLPLPTAPAPAVSTAVSSTRWRPARVGVVAGGGVAALVGAGLSIGTYAWGAGVEDGAVEETAWRRAEAANVSGFVLLGTGLVTGAIGLVGPGGLRVEPGASSLQLTVPF